MLRRFLLFGLPAVALLVAGRGAPARAPALGQPESLGELRTAAGA